MDKRSGIWTGLIALAAGIVLLFLQGTAIHIIVMILGAVLLACAVMNLILIFYQSRRASDGEAKGRINFGSTVSALIAGAFGVWLLIDPRGMTNMVVYIVAALMILAGLYHVMMLAFGFKSVRFPGWFYILPVCLIIAGTVVICIGATVVTNSLVLLLGIALIVFAVSVFSEVIGASHYSVAERS